MSLNWDIIDRTSSLIQIAFAVVPLYSILANNLWYIVASRLPRVTMRTKAWGFFDHSRPIPDLYRILPYTLESYVIRRIVRDAFGNHSGDRFAIYRIRAESASINDSGILGERSNLGNRIFERWPSSPGQKGPINSFPRRGAEIIPIFKSHKRDPTSATSFSSTRVVGRTNRY
jgi:hypothetical protein